MNIQQTLPNLQEASLLLSELLQDVQKWEGTLAGGTKLGLGATAIDSLFQTKVSFGDPHDRLVRLTEETFKESSAELIDVYQQQMRSQYNFYYLSITVSLIPKLGAKFRRLTCQLDFSTNHENNDPIVQTIFPSQKWRDVMNFGAGMALGLNGNLDWSVGVDESQLEKMRNLLPAELKSNITNQSEFKAFIAVPTYKYELGQSEITAVGEGNSVCYWRIQDQELQKIGTVRFVIVFKVPQEIATIKLRGIVWAEPDMNWLTSDIRDVLGDLGDRFKILLKRKDDAANQFARGDAEEWILTLPNTTTSP
ncbi:MAG: hypothetical protein ACK5YH_10160 [Pseudanabaena sp.]|jgi:hypothetical protein